MTTASRPKVRKDLDIVELDDELVLYDPATDEVHYLNATAALVFGLCDGSATVKEIATDIAGAIGVPEKRIERQVRTLLKELREVGLLEGSLELKAAPAAEAAHEHEGKGDEPREHEHDQREQLREQKTENA
ncbi:MAG: HPr-rel-A system PqqD family peptide chaperone [Actinobacteria bacterium]|nr:MAG: HPr-rel-A system PqqD family peptide chaperone [Actinomycetota bacterium]